MPSKKINNALATLVEGGYLTKLQAKKLVFKQVESELTFLQRKKSDAAEVPAKKSTATDSKKAEKIFYENTTFQPTNEMLNGGKRKSFSTHLLNPDVNSYLATESKKPFTETTNCVLLELYTKKGTMKSTHKSILNKLTPLNPDLDDIQIQAELYKGMNKNFVEREKTNLDTRNGVYVYWLTDNGKDYVRKVA